MRSGFCASLGEAAAPSFQACTQVGPLWPPSLSLVLPGRATTDCRPPCVWGSQLFQAGMSSWLLYGSHQFLKMVGDVFLPCDAVPYQVSLSTLPLLPPWNSLSSGSLCPQPSDRSRKVNSSVVFS